MMKKITLLASLFVGATCFAQDVTEDFESGELPAGWSTVVNEGDCDWQFGSDLPTGPDFATTGIFFDDDGCGSTAAPSNVELLTAVYNLSDNTDPVTLGYDVAYFDIAGVDDFFRVDYYDGTEWVLVAEYVEVDLTEVVTESFDLGVLSNADFQVRFTYDDGDDWSWYGGIDNFSLTGATLSNDDNELTDFSVFPTPAQNTINVSAATQIERIAIYNVVGQEVLSQTVGNTQKELDISSLTPGAYFLKVEANGVLATSKIIKK